MAEHDFSLVYGDELVEICKRLENNAAGNGKPAAAGRASAPARAKPGTRGAKRPLSFEKKLNGLRKALDAGQIAAAVPPPVAKPGVGKAAAAPPPRDRFSVEPTVDHHLTGLALSGGGIRSAAVCLGVLQGLASHEVNILQRVDYLSTVSGGGYIGGAFTARQGNALGRFPFESELGGPENDDLRRLRDFSNFLLAGKLTSVLTSLGAVIAGILANILIVLPIILLFAAITIALNPTRPDLGGSVLSVEWYRSFNAAIVVAGVVLLVAVVALYVTAPFWQKGERMREALRSGWIFAALIPLVVAFIELQPFLIEVYWEAIESEEGTVRWVTKNIVPILTAAGTALTTVSGLIGKALGGEESGKSRLWKALAGLRNMLLYFAVGTIVPLLIWASYLALTRWGIAASPAYRVACPPDMQLADIFTMLETVPFGAPAWLDPTLCFLLVKSGHLSAIAWAYFILAAIGVAAWWFVPPNAYSLHSLYRDRISYAFLTFRQREFMRWLRGIFRAIAPGLGKGASGSLDDYSQLKLSNLSSQYAPYHLINAALNIHGSRKANQRGRNADFFIFSKRRVGSAVTGWCETEAIQNAAPLLDLGTAITASGAAVSANVGAQFNRLLVFSLALLNIRLGYWLPNPRHYIDEPVRPRGSLFSAIAAIGRRLAAGAQSQSDLSKWAVDALARVRRAIVRVWMRYSPRLGAFWFMAESFGWLTESWPLVFLTDGGHIENLGLYELLRRRCRAIIVVDAEADPAMTMPSFVQAQRFARIDLGIRIELEWDMISAATKSYEPTSCKSGPHAAIGIIHYEESTPAKPGQKGLLIYIKSSLSGDESDYISDYWRRYPAFPQESTIDQFFSEEQFEAYRALGFHMVYRLFIGGDVFQGPSRDVAGFAAFATDVLQRDLGRTAPLCWTGRGTSD